MRTNEFTLIRDSLIREEKEGQERKEPIAHTKKGEKKG